jgi:hypothetical protein
MTDSHPIASQPSRPSRFWRDVILSRMDFAAILITILGICVLAVTVIIMAVIEAVKLISTFCASPDAYWLLAFFGMAIIWVVARWKRLCIF